MTIRLNGSTSGYTELDAPAVAGNNVLTLPSGNGAAGQVLTTNGAGALSWTGMGPAFRVGRNGDQAFSAATSTKVAFNSELFDTNNCFDSVTNYRFTPNVAGYYYLAATINVEASFQPNTINRVFPSISLNGTEAQRGVDFITATFAASVSSILYFNGTSDYAEVFTYVAGSSAPKITGNTAFTAFAGFLVRPA